MTSLLKTGLVSREYLDQWRYSLASVAETENPKQEAAQVAEANGIDPLLEKIAAAAPRPIEDAYLHAARLRALGAWPALDIEVAQWLNTLADSIEGKQNV